MYLRSMTGFGRGEAASHEKIWVAEIRTVNHRFLDQRVVLPRQFLRFEEAIKKKVAEKLDRGRVDLTLTCKGEDATEANYIINQQVASQYYQCLEQLKKDFSLEGSISLQEMLSLHDVITQQEHDPDMESEWQLISAALDLALTECDGMREQEGIALKKELLKRLEGFEGIVSSIEQQIPLVLEGRRKELKIRLETLLDGVGVDDTRLAQEAAILADKCDVTEEIVRLHSHIDHFRSLLKNDESAGRRLDFLLQEFLREVNTLASKISNASIAHLGVEMKNEIEKLREQVQNLE